MHFTLWPSARATTGGYAAISWGNFLAFVADPQIVKDINALEGWSPAKFRDNRRKLENVEAVSCVVLDDDSSRLPLDRLVFTWGGFAGVIHTSRRFTFEAPRYRIVLRCSRDMTPAEYAIVWRQVRAVAATSGQSLDEAPKDPSRLWFVPAHLEGAPYAFAELTGTPIDVDAILQASPVQEAKPGPLLANAMAPGPKVGLNPATGGQRRAAMAYALGAAWPAKGRHEAQLALAGALRGEGFSEAEAVDFLCTVCAVAGNEDRAKRVATCRHTYAKPPDAPLTGWTRLKSHIDPVVVDAARAALSRDAEGLEMMTRRLAEVAGPKILEDKTVEVGGLKAEIGGFNADLPPIDYQVDTLIARGEVVMFVAHGNSLKTWLAFSLSHSIATGRPWLGHYPSKRGRALIVDFESGRYEVLRRLKLLGVRDEDVGDRLLRVSYPSANFIDPETWIALASESLDVLVIDSYNAAAPELDENDARAAVMLQHAGRFAEHTGCTVIFIHHARKEEGGDRRLAVRGSTALFAACDRIFGLVDPEKSEGGRVAMTLRSLKDGAGRAPADLRVELSDQGLKWIEVAKEETAEKKANTALEDNRKRVLALLKANPAGLPSKLLRESMEGLRTETRCKLLADLVTSGIAVSFNERGREILRVEDWTET